MLAGALRVAYTDGTEETIRPGALFYLPPGHTAIVEEDVEFVEFSPARQLGEVMEVMAGNMDTTDR